MAKAKGTRTKGGGGANKENNNKTMSLNANNTDHSQNNAKGAKPRGARDTKQKIVVEEENAKVIPALDENQANEQNIKKDHHKQVQPTSTQIMLAQLIGGENMDEVQRTKIQQVMDITGKPEDAVATALFDAGWDENRAVELLLEDGEHLTAWEETGKKGKKKQKQSAEDGKDENEDLDNFNGQDFREKGKRGPPRMRRGGAPAQGGDRSTTRNNKSGDMQFANGGYDQNRDSGGPGRGRGDQPPRRGGRGGGAAGGAGGRSSYSGRGGRRGGSGGGGGLGRDVGGPGGNSSMTSGTEGGFSGSIDTWNPNGSGGEGSGGANSSSGRQRRGGGGQNSKDAFDNAGNWGDDFPAADDWDNEEYTGSLADTKVFTASGANNASKPNASADAPANAAAAAAAAAPAVGGAPTSTYSQSIDLSTLLHKPTTQSSIGSNSQSLLQFTQQATDTIKAAVGIGGAQPAVSSAGGKTGGDMSYSSYASASAAATAGNNGYGQGNSSAFTSLNKSAKTPQQQQSRSRMPPPSKIPNSAVEMPGDQLGRLDVQFGALDLQFGGGSNSANGDNVNSFEFNGSGGASNAASSASAAAAAAPPSSSANDADGKLNKAAPPASASADSYSHHPPSAKEVNKSLSNAMSAGGAGGSGKLANEGFDGRKPQASSAQQQGYARDKQGNESLYHGSSQGGYNNYGKSYGGGGHHPYGGSNNQYQSYGNSAYNQSNYSASASAAASTQNNYTKSSSNYSSSDGITKGGYSGDNAQSAANNASAVLGLTSTTNALSGKISATTASKVNIPNLPPGVTNVLPQHYMAQLPAAAFYGLQQPAAAMYSAAYGNAGLEDLAAFQRASGLQTLQAGYYDPSNQYAATNSLAAAAAGNRGDASSNLSSMSSTSVSTTSASSGAVGSASSATGNSSSISSHNAAGAATTGSGSMGSSADKSAFGNVVSANDSTSSPIPSSSTQQNLQQNAAATPATLNFATNAFAAQQQALPPGYAYFYGQIPNVQAAYGGASMYPATMAVPTAAGGTTSTQFQKSYGTSYGSTGYDALGQQGSKDFGSSYSGNTASGKSSGAAGSSGAGGAGHQYWGNNLNNQLW